MFKIEAVDQKEAFGVDNALDAARMARHISLSKGLVIVSLNGITLYAFNRGRRGVHPPEPFVQLVCQCFKKGLIKLLHKALQLS